MFSIQIGQLVFEFSASIPTYWVERKYCFKVITFYLTSYPRNCHVRSKIKRLRGTPGEFLPKYRYIILPSNSPPGRLTSITFMSAKRQRYSQAFIARHVVLPTTFLLARYSTGACQFIMEAMVTQQAHHCSHVTFNVHPCISTHSP